MRRYRFVALTCWIGACNPPSDTDGFFDDRVQIDGDVGPGQVDSFGTQLCVSDTGHLYVMWLDDRARPGTGLHDIWLNHSLNPGSTWLTDPVRINQPADDEGPSQVWNPSLYCDADVYVVWEDDRNSDEGTHHVYFNRSVDEGASFLPADVRLEEGVDGSAMALEPRISGSGSALAVAWFGDVNGAHDILATTSVDGGDSWRVPVRANSDSPAGSGYSARPKVATSRDGLTHWVVWEDGRDGGADIYLARSDDGGVTFQPDQRLDTHDAAGSADSLHPQLCTDGGQNVYVVWHDATPGSGARGVFASYSSDAGATWSATPAQVDTDGPSAADSLHPVCRAHGSVAHVAWLDDRDQAYLVYYRRLLDGVPGAAPEIRADFGTGAGGLVMASDPATRAVAVAWVDQGDGSIRYQYFERGALGGDADQDYRIGVLPAGVAYQDDVNFAVLGETWYAAWTDGQAITTDILFEVGSFGESSVPVPGMLP